MQDPRPARVDEFPELMRFIDLVFRPGQRGRLIYQRQYPHLFRATSTLVGHNLVIRDGGSIVGSMAVHPLRLRLEDVVLPAGGVGAVGAHPERRGEGIMTRLLEESIARMRRDEQVISVLGGDRQRYGWFGWENAGVRTVFQLAARHLGRPTPAERRLPVKRLDITSAVARRLAKVDRGRVYGVERPVGDMAPLFERTSRHVWGCTEGRRFAYVVLGGPRHQPRPYERVDEAGGDPELAASLLRVLMARCRCERWAAVAGPNAADVALFQPFSSGWQRSTDGMVKIIDLAGLAGLLQPLLLRRARTCGVAGRFVLRMQESGQSAELTLGAGRRHVVELSDRDMVSLLFGLLPLREAFGGPAALLRLEGVLPLPLHIPPLNHV